MMIKRKVDKFWFPWWPEKWLWGTIRIECTPAERGIWVDLLSLASKDDGHIRANEETPYPIQQLAGMLIIPEKELDAALEGTTKHIQERLERQEQELHYYQGVVRDQASKIKELNEREWAHDGPF